jgi:hypothetical protein
MSAPRDDATASSEAGGRVTVSEVAETTMRALIAVDGSDSPTDDAPGEGGDELEEWFERAATGATADEGDPLVHEHVGAATLLPQDAVVRARPSMRAARYRRVRGRALALATFALLALLSVVVAVVMCSVGASLASAPVAEVVTDASVSIDKLGYAIDRGLQGTIMRQTRADVRRRAVTQVERRRMIEGRDGVRRGPLVGRRRVATRRRGAARAGIFARTAASAASSPRPRRISPQTRRGQFESRRSTCGPFDLC